MKNAIIDHPGASRKPKGAAPEQGAVLRAFSLAAGIGGLALVGLGLLLLSGEQENIVPLGSGVVFYLIAAAWAGFRLGSGYPHRALGWCNVVTLARLVLVAALVVAMVAGVSPNWATFAVAVSALMLDGADGWLARKQGLASDFGAQFDVEVDAVFALVLAIYAATSGAASPWVVLLGLPHYLFWAARLRMAWLNGALPPSLARKAVCVLQIGALIALQVPLAAGGALDLVIMAVVLALVWSFGRDIIWLWRSRA